MSGSVEAFGGGTAVITGAAGGIGEGLARHAAALGMRLVLADIDAVRLAAVADELRAAGTEVLAIETDVSDAAAVDRLAEETYARFGAVRLLVNNAGIETTGFLWEIPWERWDLTMRVNVYGVFHGIRSFVPLMLDQGEPCHVVNLSSIGGLGAGAMQTPYIVSKHAVRVLSECLYLEMQALGAPITVSTVTPGAVSTGIFTAAQTSQGKQVEQVDAHVEDMVALLEDHGISPAEAARLIFEQVAAGRFWVVTHPEMQEAVTRRQMEAMLALRPPETPAATRD